MIAISHAHQYTNTASSVGSCGHVLDIHKGTNLRYWLHLHPELEACFGASSVPIGADLAAPGDQQRLTVTFRHMVHQRLVFAHVAM
jgi:hypothetical protein